MKQNNSTELSDDSFNNIYNINDLADPPRLMVGKSRVASVIPVLFLVCKCYPFVEKMPCQLHLGLYLGFAIRDIPLGNSLVNSSLSLLSWYFVCL